MAEFSNDPGAEADAPELDAADLLGVVVTTFSGQQHLLDLPRSAFLADVRDVLAERLGWPAASVRILHGSERIRDFATPLSALCGDAEGLALSTLRVPLQNLASSALGARVEGLGGCEEKPLLQHGTAFPAEEHGDGFLGVPEGQRLGSVLGEYLAGLGKGWDSDCSISTFLPDGWGEEAGCVVVRLPGEGACVAKAGFTYSPWDRNYGQECVVSLSNDGEVWDPAGSVATPYHGDRGDPSAEEVRTEFVEMPEEMARCFYRLVKFDWGRGGGGRRLYFLYAIGYA